MLEVPTGSESAGLGSGHVQAFLPVWLQKSWGEGDRKWTAYGGGGYDINPGTGNREWTFVGLVLQRQITDRVLLGGEIYHRTATTIDLQADTAFNLGTVIDLSNHNHLLLFKLCEDRFRNALRLLKRGQMNAPEYAGDDQSYIRSPRNAACQQGFGRVLHTQVVFDYDW